MAKKFTEGSYCKFICNHEIKSIGMETNEREIYLWVKEIKWNKLIRNKKKNLSSIYSILINLVDKEAQRVFFILFNKVYKFFVL